MNNIWFQNVYEVISIWKVFILFHLFILIFFFFAKIWKNNIFVVDFIKFLEPYNN